MQPPSSDPDLRTWSNRLSRMEFEGGWRAAAYRVYLAGHHAVEHVGFHAVRASYDSPIPCRAERTGSVFDRLSPMRGIAWDPQAQLDFVDAELGGYLGEFRPDPTVPRVPGVFRFDNNTYDRVDADLLYAVVRWAKPELYVELGSGYSSLVVAQALTVNAGDGHPGRFSCYDPYPSPHVLARPDLSANVRPLGAQALPEEAVADLRSGDVLLVDTSHTVKLGGDVNRIVLDLLPILAPGVVVHFHDIFLPYEYSRSHLSHAHFWTEQYLLQAFLCQNPDWEILVSAQAIVHHDPDRVGRLIPSFRPTVSPGAFWIRRREPANPLSP